MSGLWDDTGALAEDVNGRGGAVHTFYDEECYSPPFDMN